MILLIHTATPATNENDSDGLKGGEIAGIVIAVVFVVVVALVLAVVLAVFLWKRNSSYRQSNKKWIEGEYILSNNYYTVHAGERNRGYALLMKASKPEIALYRAPTFSLLASHGGLAHV